MNVFDLHRGTAPLLISLPHDGSEIPAALAARMGSRLAEDARALRVANAPLAWEIAVAVEKVEGVVLGFAPAGLVPEAPLPMLGRIGDRVARERLLEDLLATRGEDGVRVDAGEDERVLE